MHEKEHNIMWEQEWLEGRISKEEVLSRVGEVDDIATLLKSTEAVAAFDVPERLPESMAWEMLEEKILTDKKTKVIGIPRRYWIAGVAASFTLILCALFLFPSSDEQVFDTITAQSDKVTLPLGSVVHLNADSKISYSEENWREERIVKLEGEAFFEVTKGNRFAVVTDYGTVEVLGTSFNVRVRNQKLEVSCKTGKVKVSAPEKNSSQTISPGETVDRVQSSQIITPGQKVMAKAGVVSKPVKIDLDQVDNWLKGEYYFEAILLTEVLEEFERQFDVKLEYDKTDPNIKDRVYNGYFSNENLNEAVQLVCNPMGLTYEIKDNKVTIYSLVE